MEGRQILLLGAATNSVEECLKKDVPPDTKAQLALAAALLVIAEELPNIAKELAAIAKGLEALKQNTR